MYSSTFSFKKLFLFPIVICLFTISSKGQITYTNLDPDEIIFNDGFSSDFYFLDLDNNGISDFRVFASFDFDPPFEKISIIPLGEFGNAVAAQGGFNNCCEPFGDPLVYKGSGGELIDENINWRTLSADLDCDNCGNWSEGETGFVGLRVGSGSNSKYGWLRVTKTGGASALLLDFALEETLGEGIIAGDVDTCIPPANILVQSLNGSAAEAFWDEAPGANEYEYTWTPVEGGVVFSSTTENDQASFGELDNNTRYEFSIRSICQTGNSAYSLPREFGTTELPVPGELREINRLTQGIDNSNPNGLGGTIALGKSFARIGDLDGDGRDEIATTTGFIPLGAPGGIRILFPEGDTIKLVTNPGNGIPGSPVDIDDIAGIGDVDGNGTRDIAASEDLTGHVWIFFLNSSGQAIAVEQITLNGNPITGEEMTAIGDQNNDGIPDLAVRSNDNIRFYLLNSTGQAIATRTLDTSGFGGGSFDGIASLGDVDGDGVDDLVIGFGIDNEDAPASGSVSIALMNSDGTLKSSQKLNNTNSGNWIMPQQNGVLGRSVAALGDMDGDGIPDLAVGIEQDNEPLANAGSVLLVSLNSDGSLKSSRKLADGRNGLQLNLASDDRFGEGIELIGDTDGDGIPELAVGAPRADRPGSNQGSIYLLELEPTCGAPMDAMISNLTPTQVQLVWNPALLATGYEIEGRQVGGNTFSVFRTGTSLVRSGLQPNTDYEWRIRSNCETGNSEWTEWSLFTTPIMSEIGSSPNQIDKNSWEGSIYPNPTTGEFWIQGEMVKQGWIEVFDITGKIILKTNWPGSSIQIDASDWNSGIYLINYVDANGVNQPIGRLLKP